MATLARNLSVSFNVKKLIYFLLFIAVLIGLFFIPEMLKLKPVSISMVPQAETVIKVEEKAYLNPLDQVLSKLKSNEVVRSQEKVARPKPEDMFNGKPISWEALKSDKAVASYTQAVAVAKSILAKYEKLEDYNAGRSANTVFKIRSAIIAFIAAIDLIKGDGSNMMTAKSAAENLQNLDLAIASALAIENGTRQDYIKWMEVSLAPALQSERALEIKEMSLKPFDPRVSIVKLDISKMDKQLDQAGFPRTSLIMNATLQGNDVKKIVLLRDGVFIRNLPFSRPNENGWRDFYVNQSTAYGRWTIRVFDSSANVYEKTYQFLPFLDNYPKDRSRFILPYTEEGLSRRFDKALTVNIKKSDDSVGQGFSVF